MNRDRQFWVDAALTATAALVGVGLALIVCFAVLAVAT